MNFRKLLMFACVTGGLLTATSANAALMTFFGEDLGSGEGVRLASHTNADNARASFLGSLISPGTETFESFADGTGAPLAVNFPGAGVTATINGTGSVNNVPSGTNGAGRYPVSGDQYWETGDVFSIVFDAPVAAFGFYGVDIGDFGGQVTLTLTGGGAQVINVPNTINGAGGSVLYFGLIETATFDSITFGNTAAGTDFFGFDDMTVGSLEQIRQEAPEPSSLAMLGLGLIGLAGAKIRRRGA